MSVHQLRRFGQQHAAALDEVSLGLRALGASARRFVRLDGLQRGLVTVGGVAQKDHAQHGHAIFRGREVGVGPELISGDPQAGFNLRDVVEGVGGHLGWANLLVLAVFRGVFGLGVQRGRE